MKKILLTLAGFIVTLLAVAQSPNLLNYQGVARNSVGNVLPSQPIGLRLSILSGSPTGPAVYTETRNVTTNAFGLFNVQVGSPGAITTTGTIAGINWTAFGVGSGTKYLQVEIDPIGGTNYFNVGSTQLVSVPYSLYAAAAAPVGPAGGDLTGTYPNPQIFFPLIKTFNATTLTPPNTQLLGLTNSATTGTLGAITGTSASNDANATAIMGTMSSTSPGGFSAAVRGVNNGTGGLGIGVWGSQAGSGWGVYGTAPNGIGVNGTSTTGTGVFGTSTSGSAGSFVNSNAANTAPTLATNTNGAGDGLQAINTGTGKAGTFTINNAANANFAVDANSNGTNSTVNSTNTGTGAAGTFTVNNAASTADALRAVTNGVGASWAIRATSTGTNGAGLFISNNATATNNNLQSNTNGLGRAGLFNSTNAASTANTLEANTNGTGSAVVGNKTATSGTNAAVLGTSASTDGNAVAVQGTISSTSPGGFSAAVRGINNGTGALGIGVWGSQAGSGWGVYGTADGGIGVNGSANSGIGINGNSNTGTGGRFTTTSGLALHTTGGVRLEGIGEAANKVLSSDATGNATWQTPSAIGVVTGSGTLNFLPKWTPSGTNLGNSQVFDNGTNVGIGTTAPQHTLNVGPTTADVQTVMVRGFGGGPLNWKGGAAFGNTNATVIMGELNSVAQIGGHSSNLSAWTPLAINSVPGFNVGIGTAAPTYALDVNHNGATGLHVRSLAAFSVVDLDAANGDAALRYQSAGTTRWNVRNAPGTNDYQIIRNNSLPANVTINNGSGYVGITQTAPSYQLDVLHTGATGIRSQSSSGFSVVDIDAQNGDAALRFQAAGVGQWNNRNRPGDNYLEWFELGGGGSRMVIQDGTGNVGIGETNNPTYRLHVQHGGATGIKSQSAPGSGSFSVVDIDADNGDAALRFQRAGTGQWNTRNRPADDFYEIFELGGGGSRMVIQDGTGNVGIGESNNPTHRLHVLHGGATGIKSQSAAGSGSFSVVDIDADNGDAALRFQRAGTGQWNTRNRPGDDYYEIFELGGGGSRMVIQDGTGNVGIGETANPTYKLDVLHGGATGIRSRSSSTFSLMDIDAANGDAALRFAKAGVNQWNIRNRPADDYLEIFELGGGGSRMVIQDGTGNVGIGNTTSPSYKLDVLHGGATGLRVQSSSTFSIIDIDGANGDAALRFAKAGVNQWNVRNRPADDYFEIFELGGGGSRVVIQDGTGNLGVGETTNPTYKLDVLHGGATGIRSRSNSTFSLVDIDAANGDAALRFAKAGVNQWNIRNNPANDDLQIFELGGGGERMRIENTTGNVVIPGNLSKGGGSFKIDHPLDPANKFLYHSFVESPDMMNIYNGNITTDASGKATVKLPDYFEALNMDFRYQLTVIGSFAQAIVNKEVSGNQFEIATNQPNVKVSWQVTGVRHDAYANQNRIPNTVDKVGAEKGKYLHPKAFNQPQSKAIGSEDNLMANSSSLNALPATDKKAAPATTGGSLDQGPITKPSVAKVDNSGSVADVAPAKASVKKADVSGSVIDVPAAKPSAKKVDVSGSVQDLPVTKPAVKKADTEGSVAPPAKKEAVKPVATPAGSQSVNG